MAAAADATLLERYHRQPGRSVALCEAFRDPIGRTTYSVLADEVDDRARSARLLDLACGDGHLLALLGARGFRQLVGIDASASELGAARQRLGPDVDLRCGRAENLPWGEGSFDAVLCHMALMLMDPLERVLSEVARVLGRGGVFVALLNRPHSHPAASVFSQQLRQVTREAGLERLRLGTPDVWAAPALRAAPFGRRRCRDFIAAARLSPGDLWRLYASSYDVFRLPEASVVELSRRVVAEWAASTDGSGELEAEIGVRLITCVHSEREA